MISSKKKCHYHAILRFRERFGMDISEKTLEKIINQIQENRDVVFVRSKGRSNKVWLVEVKGVLIKVYYNKIFKCVTTILTPSIPDRKLYHENKPDLTSV